MHPVISPAEAARLDAVAPDPVTVLMDRAGYGVARIAAAMGARYGSRVVVLAGPGNNGGDGYVAAAYLRRRGVAVEVHALAPPGTDAARWAAAMARRWRVRVVPLREPTGRIDLVIDALFGGGFRRGIPPSVAPWLDADLPVLSVDVPTGLDPSTGEVPERAFTALRTVTFEARKTGHLLGEGPDRCGDVEVVPIGLGEGTPDLFLAGEADCPRPRRDRTAHKWSAGSVLVAGGAAGMVGAAVIAGKAALHFGAGAVGVASPSVELVQALAPELLAHPLGGLPDRYGTLVVGPGLGDAGGGMVERLLSGGRPLVLDADGLARVSLQDLARATAPVLVTPHAGEFQRLTEEDPGPDAAVRLARYARIVVLLKGNPTFVTDGGTPVAIASGGPELATIGTGDVLSGMIGALVSRGLDLATAARSAAYWHGVAASELAAEGTVTADRLAVHVGRHAWSERA